MNPPDFTLEKIKFGTDAATFGKAVALYQSGKVTEVKEGIRSYSATVLGSQPYKVNVEARDYRYAYCTCYIGQKDSLCKHMIALAIYLVKNGQPLLDDDTEKITSPKCSGDLRQPSTEKLDKVKEGITTAMRYIKPYTGPSRTWFANQHSLEEGCNRNAVRNSNPSLNKLK